ncbi:MAG: hypothetical protein QOK01_991 [Alphaproteobacteria bacterium]|nr:hypothetical protein [Alphaproteobacteria bacterium]
MPEPQSMADNARSEPYRNYRFKVKWDDMYVAGVSKVSGLERTTEVVKRRTGDDPSIVRVPSGPPTYSPVTLEQGVTHDVTFAQWANKVWDYGRSIGPQDSLKDFRKDIVIELYNESGQKVAAYIVRRCWVSEFQALPELDRMGDALAIQTLTLQNEGWERDQSITATSVLDPLA